jgi:CubicO group peptidase (beta-lactamase class C family)
LAAFHPEKWSYTDYPRLFKPGTGWNYGTSTDWAGRVVEKISGQDLETYLREHVTGPLKMDHTWFNVPEALQEKIVSWGSRDSTGALIEAPRLPLAPVTKFSAGGGLYSSPNDYLKFLHCMLNFGESNGVRILKRETVEMMLRDNLPETVHIRWEKSNEPDSLVGGFQDNEDRFGLAWAIEANPAEKIRPMGAVYWAGAANSYYTLDVKNKVAIVYFTQFFPFNDRESYDFYKLYERGVYELH